MPVLHRPKNRFARSLALFVLAVLPPAGAQAPAPAPVAAADPVGGWSGAIELPGSPLGVHVELVRDGDVWSGTIDIPVQGATDLPLEAVAVEGDAVTFRIAGVPGEPTFEGTVSEAGDEITGTFAQGGATLPFRLERGDEAPAEVGPDARELPDPREALADLPEVVERGLAALRVPGLALAVVAGDEVVLSRGFGLRDREEGLPVTPETIFAIGSSTKAMTAAVVGTLVDDGEVAWNDPVREHLPAFRLSDPTIGERLTVRDLLTHRSGLPRHDLAWYGSERSREELVEAIRHLDFSADLRERFQYQNLMYLTAGYLAGEVTGSSWEELMRERIFEPLGMDETVISRFEGFDDVAVGYNLDRADEEESETGAEAEEVDFVMEPVPYRVIEAMGPAGSVNSNVEDMAHWVRFQLGDGTFGGERVLAETTLHETHTPQMIASLPLAGLIDPRTSPYILYGLGWFIQPYRGEHLIHHGGNIDGFSAMVAFLPDHDLGVVALSNANGSPLPLAVALSAFDRLLGKEPVDWVGKAEFFLQQALSAAAEEEAAAAAERVEGTSPSHPIEDYAGEYQHPGYGTLRVTEEDGALAFTMNGLEGGLEHWHYDVFDAADGPLGDVKLEFLTSLDGRIDRVRTAVEPTLPPAEFEKAPPAALSDPSFLSRLTGEYLLAGQTVTVALRGETLTVSIPGQPTYELAPSHGTEFVLEDLPAYRVRFEIDPEGTGPASALELAQPNGTFRAERKPVDESGA